MLHILVSDDVAFPTNHPVATVRYATASAIAGPLELSQRKAASTELGNVCLGPFKPGRLYSVELAVLLDKTAIMMTVIHISNINAIGH